MITAQVVLLNKEGLVLGVSRKNDHTDFGLAGGKMEDIDNNDPMATAIRECKEETGLDVSNLRLVFAIHKSGNMGYTYLADYEGEINHNEPHLVKWVPFQLLINGSFGRYNKMVSESLTSMGIKYQIDIDEEAMAKEVEAYFLVKFDGDILFSHLYKDVRHSGAVVYEIHIKYPDVDIDDETDKEILAIGVKYGVDLSMSIDCYSK
jgi:ADP-ribose pyrophosphatase YjhB (NUDIX family)